MVDEAQYQIKSINFIPQYPNTNRTDAKAEVRSTPTRGAATRSIPPRLLLCPQQVHFPRNVLHLAHLHHHTVAVQGGGHDWGRQWG